MKKDPIIFLNHIQESISLIKKYTKNITYTDFERSIQVQDSIIRRLEIIGEAIKNIPTEFTKKYPEIPWREIAGLRDI